MPYLKPSEVSVATFFIYGLLDSGDWSEVRYVGAASYLGRPLLHEWAARRYADQVSYKFNWIRKVLREGRHVAWEVLAACDSWEETMRMERAMVVGLRAAGHRLTNANDGGVGSFNPSPEVRTRMSAHNGMKRAEVSEQVGAAWRTCQENPDTRRKWNRNIRAACSRPEVRARRSAARSRVWKAPDARARMIASNKATWADPQKRAAQVILMRETMATPEYHAAASARRVAAWADPVVRARMVAGIRAAAAKKAV
jgi:hypothetical protein